nr:hypothetical protein KK1_047552 [Cajanus cajan]
MDLNQIPSQPFEQARPSASQPNVETNIEDDVVVGLPTENVFDPFSEDEDEILSAHEHDDEETLPIPNNPPLQPQPVAIYNPPPHFLEFPNEIQQDSEYSHLLERDMVVYPPGTLFVGQRFQTKEQMQDAINRFHIVNHCSYKVKNSSSSRLVMECVHHDCAWRCRGILRTREQHWEIMILEGPHTCVSPLISQDHNKLGSQMIAQSIGEIIEVDPSASISTIIAHIKSTMGYTISYRKGWLAKQHAIENIFGNWEESYNKLPGMLQAMQMYVPGFIWKLNTQPAYQGELLDEGSVIFKRLFWTFKPCIDGFAFCKPIVQVDGTFLYGRYKGTLLVAVAQDGRNNIIPIAFAVVEGETSDAWFFFLKNLRRYVTPQDGLCLISDRHEAIRSAYSRNGSGWTENNSVHVYCIRHIAQNFMRRFKNAALKKDVVNMAYGMTEPRFFYYYNIVRDTNVEAAQWLDNIPREKWTLAWDNGRRWGHMTTNLAESINSVLKKTRNLPICSMVMATYTRCNKFFVQRGTEVGAMINAGHVYSEIANKTIQDAQSKANTHRVISFDRSSIHIPCSHVLASCLHAHHDYERYISPIYTLQQVAKVYEGQFGELRHEDYWPTYTGPTLWPNPELKRTSKGRPKSTRIRTEMDIREQHTHVKNCSYCHTPGHTRKTCPNISHGCSSRHQ